MDARGMILALLAKRRADATICPSEVARALAAAAGSADWRQRMPEVHAASDALLSEGSIRLSWKGAVRPTRVGPYRIGRAQSLPRFGPTCTGGGVRLDDRCAARV